MKQSKAILEELKLISPLLAGMDKINPFTVPDGYFQQFGDDILEKTIYLPSFINTEHPPEFTIPAGYFDNLSSQILSKVKSLEEDTANNSAAVEIRKLSPMLYALQGEEVYKVPNGYFSSLSEIILHRVRPARRAPIVAFGKKSIWQMAAAAVITCVIATSAFFMINKTGSKDADKALAFEKSAISNDIKLASTITSEAELNKQIASLPAEEIISYLEKNTSDADLDLLASTVNESELPEQADYLTDDEALDKYLDKISEVSSN